MPTVPEFLLRKLYVKDSLKDTPEGFTFQLENSFAPVNLHAFQLELDGKTLDVQSVTVTVGAAASVAGENITAENPLPLPVGERVTVAVKGQSSGNGHLRILVDSREAGQLSFSIQAQEAQKASSSAKKPINLMDLFNRPYRVEAKVHREDPQPINPFVYGHFIEHLEDCIYGGIWDKEGKELRPDTLELIRAIKPSIVRYPGGNFASGYHWEDGIGPKAQRPPRFDAAWNSWDSNQVGTDEFMAFCATVNCEPFLVVNDGNGTPEEAARWVAYCNEVESGEQGQRRAANGHPAPYKVRVWGIGNEVWGRWQIGHTTAEEYAARLVQFARAMRAVDPDLYLVAVGDKILSDAPNDPGRLWNETVLRQAGEWIDAISFHLYQPDQEGWKESYDPDELHHIICAAPLAAEEIIRRMACQAAEVCPRKNIQIVFDEWNLWLTPPENAVSMHKVLYTMSAGLYGAGMLNVFQRQSRVLSIANLAQMVNILPLIVTNDEGAYATPLYYPFQLYTQMEKQALEVKIIGRYFDTPALGNIPALKDVPYCDVVATCDESQKHIVVSVVNRHPKKRVNLDLDVSEFGEMKTSGAWLLTHPDPQASNSFEEPLKVCSKEVTLPEQKRKKFRLALPPCSVALLDLKSTQGV